MSPRKQPPAHNLKTTRSGAVKRRSVFWRSRRVLYLGGLLAVAAVAGALWAASQVQLPSTDPTVAQTSFICTANITTDCNEKNAIESLHGNVNRVSVPLSQISPAMQAAVLAAEDKDFFKHGGVDPVGILRAAFIDLTGGNVTHGGSTLTQQYVKLTYLSQERTFKRKIKEAALSIKLEQKLSKKEIFQRYLNLVYFGRGAYGVQAAAQAYFNEDASHLDLAQSAMLAGIIRNPTWAASPSRSKDLRHLVLGNMLADHFINRQQHDLADGTPLGVLPFTPTNGATWLGGPFGPTGDPAGAKYFMNYVERQLVTRYHLTNDQIFNGGLRIYTTLDPTMQQAAYNAVTSTLDWQGHPLGALVAIDKSGQVKAMMGGTAFGSDNALGQSQFNLATDAKRSSGSTFKAFALAEAVHEGYSIGSIVPAPFKETFPPDKWHAEPYPVAADCCASGSTTLADGLKFSVNTAYVNTSLDLGPDKVATMARRMGVSSPALQPPGGPLLSNVLGTHLSVLDLASAYSTFADNGIHTDPIVVTRVEDANGNVLLSNTPKRTVILTKDENAKVVYAMQQVIKGGTGTNADIGRPAAGKTGTDGSGVDSDPNNKNAWFSGYVPGFTATVWMGNLHENDTMPASIQGATFPSEIWRKFMSAVLVNTPPADFPPEPADLWGGRYLTSWGGTSGDYTNQGQGSTGTDTGSGPSTTTGSNGQGPSTTTGGGPATTPAPATTAAPATTSPPVTNPPPTTAATPPPANARAPSG
jgi:penicillin-binding protein 1A